jgi:hypothetical protein
MYANLSYRFSRCVDCGYMFVAVRASMFTYCRYETVFVAKLITTKHCDIRLYLFIVSRY